MGAAEVSTIKSVIEYRDTHPDFVHLYLYKSIIKCSVVSGMAIVLNFLVTKPLQSKSIGPYTVPCNV